MKKKKLLFLFLGIQFFYVSCSKDNNSSTTEPLVAETFMNVSYGNNPQEKYDLYLPANRSSEKTKVIVLVHGGGWIGGDKTNMDSFVLFLQKTHPNHAIVNINYVLADANTPAFPKQLLDLDTVIKKLTNEKDELNILPQFALIGTGAGAHISLMYDYGYDADNQVKMVADIVGPSNFTDPFYRDNPNFPLYFATLVDDHAYPSNTNYAEELSPALRVSNASSPTLLFYGNADLLIPLSNATTLNSALNIAEINHNFTVYDGGHGNWTINDLEDMKTQISTYLDTYLGISE